MLKQRSIISFLFVLFTFQVCGQLSDGGLPLDVPFVSSLKSKAVIHLPSVDNQLLLKASLAGSDEKRLKPFRFAKPVEVSLNTENSGRWLEFEDYRVWQLRLVSAGAKSLNLIFDRYKLPEGARLFLFSADRSDIIGAFTSKNNKETGTFASSPVIGDQLVIQYEEPLDAEFEGELSVRQVNHDFVGIKSLKSERRPLGLSGLCNINVNCDIAKIYRDESNATCRILISGTDLCTGALVNNTNEDGTPYVYTAAHCINTNEEADESIFLFNYESPYCGEIDGDASHSLGGSILRAASDSLDFSLVELNEAPPPSYRPYYLGWERGSDVPNSSVCIHHPLGDVKKIAIDKHAPQINTYSVDYIRDAFLLIGGWEEGTTEGGSSGAPLINQNNHLVGSLTGGAASCADPYNDYFAMFSYAWDYYLQPNQQLKVWLDPDGTNNQLLEGFSPYIGEDLCGAYTNFTNEDAHENIKIIDQDEFKGYWSGNNDYGFTAFAERFEKFISCEVVGVSIGVAKAVPGRINSTGKIKMAVYDGDLSPDNLLYSQTYNLKSIDEGVMNYLEFAQTVKTTDTFFIAYSLELLEPIDTFSVFLANRDVNPINTFFIKDGEEWYTYQEKTDQQEGTALLMEAVLCNLDTLVAGHVKKSNLDFEVFPNPFYTGQKLLLKFKEPISPHIIRVFDLMGRQINVGYEHAGERWLRFDFSGQIPGNYFIEVVDLKGKRYHARAVCLGDY